MKICFKFSLILFYPLFSSAQFFNPFLDAENLVDDAIFYTQKYITPATDAAIYQASSGWITSTKKKKLGEVVLGINSNLFFVPKADRKFRINNEDFNFFSIDNNETIYVPTALGDNTQYYISGNLFGSSVRLKTPEGVNDETVFYSYLQGGVGLWYGTELLVKYSPKTKLKKGDYQVYGAGIKHNIDQYFSTNFNKSIHLTSLIAYSLEKLNVDFVEIQSNIGGLSLNSLNAEVETFQAQLNISKTYKKIEVIWGAIYNVSNLNYQAGIDDGIFEIGFPLSETINDRLQELNNTKRNLIGEFSGRYQFSKFFVQGTLAFGKFVNTNVSLQYEF